MAQALNIFLCAAAGCNNTGMTSCNYNPENITGAIFLPKGKTYTQAQVLTLNTLLVADAMNNDPSQRIYPIKPFIGSEDKSGESVTETFGYGGQSKVRSGKPGINFEMNHSLCHWKKIRKFDNKQNSFDVILVDGANNVLWGTTVSNGGFKGFSLDMIDVPMHKFNTGANSFKYMVNLVFSNIKEWDASAVVQFENTVAIDTLVNGLIDVELNVITPVTAAGLVVLGAKAGCGGTNMAPTFNTNLAQVTAWTATRNDTGAVLPIGTVSANAALNGWNVTVTLPTVALMPLGTTFTVNLANPSVLAAAPINMPGYAGCGITLTRI